MRRLDTLLVLLAVTVLLVFGAGFVASAPPRPVPSPPSPSMPPPARPQLLVEGAIGPVVTLDPQFATTPAERSIGALLFRGLTRLGPDGAIVPDLATHWEIDPSGTSWTFHIRPDARWHDGVHVSADDVLLTVETLADPAYTGPAAADWQGVTAERVDRFTVRLHLPAPIASFLPATIAPLVPAHLLAGTPLGDRPGTDFARAPVGSGPFALETLRPDFVVLRRVGSRPGGDPAVYGPDAVARAPEPTPHRAGAPRPFLERYRFQLYPDAASLIEALDEAEVQVAAGLGPSDLGPIARDRAIEPVRYPGTRALALVPNLRFSTEPLRDAAVRRALSLAIDRGRIGAEVFSGAALPANTLLSPGSSLYEQEASGQPLHDPEAARAGLLAAGWTESATGWQMPGATEPVSIELLVRDAPEAIEDLLVAERIAEDWTTLGVDVRVVPLTPDVLLEERLRPGSFDVALLDVELGLDPDLYPLLVSTEAVVGGSNLSGYQSSFMDRLLDEARRVAEPEVRAERSRALQATLAREMPIIPITFPDHLFLVRDGVVGPTPRQIPDPRERYWDVLTWRLASRPDG